eukprot:Phypoly_transcript_00021.p1 GENE.Phypoly_transcript_00021~~Phypoly_transcript_00021.p1  ORF type:complete len:3252 (+),score=335.79 Phypoly_transcript_00021:281-10036(+)
MFETIVADLLAKYLGNYIRGLNTENLKIGIWSGNASLENLELAESALEYLNLPFTVKKGFLGKLTLKIPWHNLKGEPVIVKCDNVFAIASPCENTHTQHTPSETEREFRLKMQKLAATDAARASNQSIPSKSGKDVQTSTSFATQFLTKIIDNVQISLYNVHVMVESSESYPNAPYTAGVTLEHLHVKSCTPLWVPAFIHVPHESVYKIVELKNLAVYWNPHMESMKSKSNSEIICLLNQMIYKEGGNDEPHHQYILHPICGTLKIELTKSKIGLPNYTCHCEFDDITIELRPAQYRDLMDLTDWFSRLEKGRKYCKFLPSSSLGRPKINPRAWWHFAMQCVIADIHERRFKWSSKYFAARKVKKQEYIHLFKAKKRSKIQAYEQQRLTELEYELSYEDLVFFRTLAEAQLQGEATQPQGTPVASQSWRDWIWYYWSPSDKAAVTEPTLPVELSPEQRKELYSAIDYDEQKPEYIEVPKDHVFVHTEFLMHTGSILLQLQDGPQREDADLAAVFTGLHLSLSLLSQSFKVGASLASTDIYDCYSPDTLYPCLIGPLTQPNMETTALANKPPVFDMEFQVNPIDSEADYSLTIKVMPLEIVYNKSILEEILMFFGNAPRSALDNIEKSARDQYEALKNKTTLKIQYELQHYKTIYLDVNIHAPRVLIPEDIFVSSPVLLLDLGLFSITSMPKVKSKALLMEPVSQKATLPSSLGESDRADIRQENEDIDAEKKEQTNPGQGTSGINPNTEFYDKFHLSMSNIQLVLINENVKEQLVDPFNINFSIFNCMIKSQTLLSQLKIFGDLPSLRFYMSPSKIQTVMQIFRVSVIPMLVANQSDIQHLRLGGRKEQGGSHRNPRSGLVPEEVQSELFPSERNPRSKNNTTTTSTTTTRMATTTAAAAELEGLVAAVTLTECSFTVPEIIIEICDLHAEILRVGIIGLQGQLVERTYDTKVFLSLNQIWVEDHYQLWGEPFSFMAHSSSDMEDRSDLIKACYTVLNKSSPFYTGVDHFLDFNFNSLALKCNRETLLKLREMLQNMEVPQSIPQCLSTAPLATASSSLSSSSSSSSAPSSYITSTTYLLSSGSSELLTNFKVRVSIHKVALELNVGGKHFAVSEMLDLQLVSRITPQSFTACGKLGNITVTHLSPTALKDVGPLLGTDGTHMIDFMVEFGTPIKKNGLIRLRMSTLRVVLSPHFWYELGDYFATMPSVRKMPVDPSKAVEMISDSFMIKFEVLIASPHIVVPRHNPTGGSFSFQLGQITIYNMFSPFEVVHVRIVSMQAQSMYQHSAIAQPLMQPVDVAIDVNLGLPIEVSIKITEVNIVLTEKQYSLLISIIRDNYIVFQTYQKTNGSELKDNDMLEVVSNFEEFLQSSVPVGHAKGTVVQIALELEQFAIEIFRGHELKDSVMAFYTGNFKYNSAINANDSIQSTIALQSLTLRDTRKSNNQFKQLLGPSSDADPEIMQLRVNVDRSAAKNWDILVTVDHLRSIVVADAINAIINFVYPGIASISTISTPPSSPQINSAVQTNSAGLTIPPASPTSPSPISPPHPTTSMHTLPQKAVMYCVAATIRLNHAEMCAVADPYDPSTQAFRAKSDTFTIRMNTFPEAALMEIGWFIENLEVVKCVMGNEKTSIVGILAPTSGSGSFSIAQAPINSTPSPTSFSGPFTPFKNSQNSSFPFPTFNSSSAPSSTSSTHINSCFTPFQGSPSLHKGSKATIIAHFTSTSSNASLLVIAIKPLHITFSYHDLHLALAIGAQLSSIDLVLSSPTSTSPDFPWPAVNIQMPGAELLLIDDYSACGRSLPLINAKLSDICIEILQDRKFVGLKVAADYYNGELCAWEPFIEPWQCRVGIHTPSPNTHHPPTATSLPPMHSSHAPLFATTPSLASPPPHLNTPPPSPKISAALPSPKVSTHGALEIVMLSNTPLNINFSKPLVDTCTVLLSLFQRSANPPNTIRPALLVPLILRNDCGQIIEWECYSVNEQEERHSGKIDDGVEQPLWLNSEGKHRGAISFFNYRVNLSILPWDTVTNLPIDKAGTYIIPLSHPTHQQNPTLVYKVTSRESSKLLIIRANVLVQNTTKHCIDTLLDISPRLLMTTTKHAIKSIGPNTHLAVPLSLVTAAELQFCSNSLAAPQWSAQKLQCGLLAPHTEFIHCKPYFYCLQVVQHSTDAQDSNHHDYQVCLSPAFVVSNQLPNPIQITLTDHTFHLDIMYSDLDAGESLDIYEVDPNHLLFLRVKMEGFDCSTFVQINQSSSSDINRQFITLLDEKKCSLNLNIEYVQTSGCVKVVIYCKYWIVNRTGLPALYKPNTRMFAFENLAPGQKEITSRQLQLEGDPRDWYHHPSVEKIASSKPLLFSFVDDEVQTRNRMISIKIANSEWSKGLWIESPGTVTHTTLHCIDSDTDEHITQLQLSMSVELAEGKFFRTRVVTFFPQYILINHLEQRIYYKQRTALTPAYLDPGEKMPFHWQDQDVACELAICIEPFGKFSGGFRVDGGNGDWMVKIPLLGQKEMVLILVQVMVEQGITFVLFKPYIKGFPPYRIENYLPVPIVYYQKDIGTKQALQPGKIQPYAWDELTGVRRLVVSIPGSNFERDYSLDRLKSLPLTSVAPLGVAPFNLAISVFADGPTKVFRIADAATSLPVPPILSDPVLHTQSFLSEAPVFFIVRTLVSHVGLSVIDSTPQELAYMSFDDIELLFAASPQEQELTFSIHRFQMDNQLLNTPFPVIISHLHEETLSADHTQTHTKPASKSAFLSMHIVRQVPTHHSSTSTLASDSVPSVSAMTDSLVFVREFQMHVTELNVKLEEEFLTKVSDFIMLLFPVTHVLDPNIDVIPTPKIEEGDSNLIIYLEHLYLPPLEGTLSFTNSSSLKVNSVVGLRKILLGSLVNAVANIDNARVHLAGWQLDHQFVTQESMAARLVAHYKEQSINVLYKVLLWGDLLGSPLGLLGNVSTGVYDLVTESAQGLETGAFVDGIAKGTSSLIKNSVFGIFNTTNKISKSVGKVLAPLSMDNSYIQSRVEADREAPSDLYRGLSMGMRDLTHGFMGGLKGIFVDPIHGAQEEGVTGLVKGVQKGVMSALVKPTVGAIDLITRTSQGACNSASTIATHCTRARPPRYFASDKVLQPYDISKSYWQNGVLYWLEQGKHRSEFYVIHFEVENKVVLISTHFVFYLSTNSASGPKIKWKIAIRDISKIVESDHLITFHLHSPLLGSNNTQEHVSIKKHFTLSQNQMLSLKLIKEIVECEQKSIYTVVINE